MGGQKTLTIGVTVNLEHYENLRLEVSGDVDSPEDAEDLARFLDTILGRFGRNDPGSTERVDSYRRRVLPGSVGSVNENSDSGERGPEPGHEAPVQGTGTLPLPPEIPPISAAIPSEPSRAATASCSSFGAPVSPAEQKMSQLFTSRTLCRTCMKNL